jgi:hypothetical protein
VSILAENKCNFDDLVTQKCKHYYDLEAVLGDRSGAAPMANNYDTLDTDYESKNSGKNDNNLDSR